MNSSIDTTTASIVDLANGAIKERVDVEMGRVVRNILDINTKATTPRKITVTLTLTPDEARQHVEVAAEAKATLAPMVPVRTSLAVGTENGKQMAVELTPQIPGQLDAYGGQAPARKVVRFEEIAS